MAKSKTPICDLVERLLKSAMSTPDMLAAARLVEAAATNARGSTETDRNRWKEQKALQRKTGGGQSGDPLVSNNTLSLSSEVKEEIVSRDDWPEDFVDRFWNSFPPFRRQAKAKVAAKLARIRAQTGKQKVTWATLFGGVLKFAATNPGEYAPAPMVWLNDGRWDREYGNGGSNGTTSSPGGARPGFSGLAANLRRRVEDTEREFPDGGECPEGPR